MMTQTETFPQQGVLTLSLGGELDHHRTKEVIDEIREKIDCALPKSLVLDLGGLTFSDSSGIAVLLRVSRSMTQIGGRFEVVGVQAQPWRLFQTAGLEKMISITPQF